METISAGIISLPGGVRQFNLCRINLTNTNPAFPVRSQVPHPRRGPRGQVFVHGVAVAAFSFLSLMS
jgi:hypothetical protein